MKTKLLFRFSFALASGSDKPFASVQRILSFLLLLFLPAAAFADGMVIPTIAYPAKVTIPDQRALICFSNGIERLVIETRFAGAGTNFAWVVPLPSQPVIEEATTGLFPTLQFLFRPKIVHDVPRYWLRIITALLLVCFFRWLAKRESVGCAILVFFVLLFLTALLLPALSAAKRAGMESPASEQDISILDRKLVGIFETATIASRDAKALHTWLAENEYAVPTNAEPIIAGYVKDGWVFVATKVRRDRPDSETSTPHPLSFTFKTERPVYPMRLTGLNSKQLKVELYVFGPERATAQHFTVERCTRPNYPERSPDEPIYHIRWTPEMPNILHPLLRRWVGGSPVVTKLVGTLSPADMRRDVWLDWRFFLEKKSHRFSRTGALTTALNWGAAFFAGGLVVVGWLALVKEKHKIRLTRGIGHLLASGVILAGLIYLGLPKIEVRLEKGYRERMEYILYELGSELSAEITNHLSVADVRLTARNIITIPQTNAPYWKEWSNSVHWASWQNHYVGGPLREEDSPGNYTIRETDGRLEFVSYDVEGAEHVQTIPFP